MSNQPQRSLRLLPRNDFSKLTGSRGEIFYDSVTNTLRVFNGQSQGGEVLATRTWVTGQLPSTAGLATQTFVNQAIAAIPLPVAYQLKIAADDSTVLAVGPDETLQIRGQGMITTSISADSTGIQLVITAPDVSNADINVNQQFGSSAVIPTERVVKSYADLLFNIQTAQLQNGTLDVTLNTLVFNQGVGISEVTNDPEFPDNSPSSVPTEAAVRGYIDRRLGLTHNGSVVSPSNKIGPGYAPLNGATFTGPVTVTGATTLQQTTEVLNTKTGATGTVEHDYATGAIWYHTSIAANFVANFTNVPTTNNRTINVVLILVQGSTARLPIDLSINGATQTINWLTVPTGSPNKIDLVSFTLIRTGSAWTVLGSLSTHG